MDLQTVYSLFTDCWKLYKQYSETDLRDKELMDFTINVERLRVKYENNKFSNELLVAIINEIERIEKIKHGGERACQ